MRYLLVIALLSLGCTSMGAPTTIPQTVWTLHAETFSLQPIAGVFVTLQDRAVGLTDAQGNLPIILAYQQPNRATLAKRGYRTASDTITPMAPGQTWTFFLSQP